MNENEMLAGAEKEEEYEMGGNIGTDQAGTYALILDTLRAGRGGYGGGGEGGMGGFGPYASPGANAVRLDRNADVAKGEAECTRGVLGSEVNSMRQSFEGLERNRSFDRISDDIHQQDLVGGQREVTHTRELADIKAANALGISNMEKEMLKCCCDQKELIYSENQKTRDLISENALRAAVDLNNINATVGPINAAAAANTAALIAAIQGIGHHGH